MSDSVQPHRRQPTRLRRPWDSPGKNTGVGCHFLLHCMKVKSESEFAQSCLTLCDPMDCSPPGSSIHGIFQARALEWGAIAFSTISMSIIQSPENCRESPRNIHLKEGRLQHRPRVHLHIDWRSPPGQTPTSGLRLHSKWPGRGSWTDVGIRGGTNDLKVSLVWTWLKSEVGWADVTGLRQYRHRPPLEAVTGGGEGLSLGNAAEHVGWMIPSYRQLYNCLNKSS